ncbi:SMI1/KNR4 family protein [Solirubrobacter pauli]|uniref:SMI1/KNR4 family protein n=1 Tax=Solirubrobacter pauli TaxID=166793 RepID=UPI0011C41339|nr:SMI1/KNR4 family protein [Solirubrobacter pauli]
MWVKRPGVDRRLRAKRSAHSTTARFVRRSSKIASIHNCTNFDRHRSKHLGSASPANGLILRSIPEEPTEVDRAIALLVLNHWVTVGGTEVDVALLVRDRDVRPLTAPWWTGKQVSVVAVDVNGNFFLRHPGGSVLYWHHINATEFVVASSVREFLRSLHPRRW